MSTQFTLRPPGTATKTAVLDAGSATSPAVFTASQSGMYRDTGGALGISVNGTPRIHANAGNVALLGNSISAANVITSTHLLTIGGERKVDGLPAVQPTWQNLGIYTDPPTPALQLTLSNVSTYQNTVTNWGITKQPTLTTRPTYVTTDPIDGKPAIAFARANLQHLRGPPVTLNCGTNGGLTVVCMFKFTGTPNAYEMPLFLSNSGNNANDDRINIERANLAAGVNFWIQNGGTGVAGATSTIPVAQDQWTILAFRYVQIAGTWTLQIFKNGAQLANGSASAQVPMTNRSMSNIVVGGRSTGSNMFNGAIRYLGVWDRPLSDAELAKVTEAARIYPDLQGVAPICRFLQGARDSCLVEPAADALMPGPTGFPGSRALNGAVLLPDGRIFCVPWLSATTARLVDPRTNVVTTPAITFPSDANGAFQGGVLLPNGKVFLVPRNSAYAMQFDPATETVTTPAPVFPGAHAHIGGVGLPDGRVFMVPYHATYALVYDSQTDSVSTIGAGAFPGSAAYVGGTIMADGRVFCVPHNATSARIVDVSSNSVSTPNGPWPGPANFYGGAVLLPNGNVFIPPHSNTTARVYDPIQNVLSTPNGTYASNGYRGAVLLSCGRVAMIPWSASQAVIYDVETNSLSTVRGTITSPDRSFHGAVLLPDGRIFLVPSNTTQALYLVTGGPGLAPIPNNILMSPWMNNK
jgi:hypothetical protein